MLSPKAPVCRWKRFNPLSVDFPGSHKKKESLAALFLFMACFVAWFRLA
jgi:hypothetical protein